MSFSNEIKTILKLDDKDWKKALSSISDAEKQYYKEAKGNTEEIIRAKKDLLSLEKKQASQLKSINSDIAKTESNLTKAREANNNKLIKSFQRILAAQKQQRTEIKASTKVEIDSTKQTIKEINTKISAQERYNATLKKAKANFETLAKGSSEVVSTNEKIKKSTDSLTNSVVRHLRQVETLIVTLYLAKNAWDNTMGIGIEVNKMMEDNTSGIAALLSANTQMVLSNQKVVSSYDKFIMGQKLATETMEELRKASVKTYATFPQLTEIFQQAIGQTLSMGDSFGTTTKQITENTIKLSQRMSNIAGAIGMPMDRVKEEIRSLLSGNASTDSLIATMLFGNPGEANKAIREARERGENGVKNMLDGMLKPFDILAGVESYTKNLLSLQDAWSNLMKTMSESTFETLKDTFKDLAEYINSATEALKEYNIVSGVTQSSNQSNEKIKTLGKQWQDLQKRIEDAIKTEKQYGSFGGGILNFVSANNIESLKVAQKEIEGLISLEIERQKVFDKTKNTFTPKEQAELITKVALNEAVIKDIKKFTKKEEDEIVKLNKQKAEWQKVYIEDNKKLNQQTNQNETAQSIILAHRKQVVEGIEATEKRINEIIAERTSVSNVTKGITTTGMSPESRFDLYEGLFAQYKDSEQDTALLGDWINKVEKKINKELKNIDIEPIELKFTGWDDVSNNIGTIATSMDKLNRSAINYNKIQDDVTKTEKQKKQASVDYASTTIQGYGNMAGAMASFYDEDSKERKNLMKVQHAMNIANMAMMLAELQVKGSLAILTQGTGDPYTAFARMAAMAAIVASMGIVVQGAFSGGGNENTYEQISNPNTTTVFGGGEDESTSLANSLETLRDYAKPQYKELSKMADLLENIDKNIAGVGRDVLRTGDFALGVGGINATSEWSGDVNDYTRRSLDAIATTVGGAFGATVGGILTGGIGAGIGGAAGAAIGLGVSKGIQAIDSLTLGGAATKLLGKGLSAIGMGGGGYNWQKLAGSGIAFGTSNAQTGQTYRASGSYYGDVRSQQSFRSQTLEDFINNFEGLLFQSQAFESMSKSRWGSASYSYWSTTRYQELDKELSNSLSRTFENIRDSIVLSSAILEEDVLDRLNKMNVNIGNIDLSGLTGEEVVEKLEKAFSAQSDKFVDALYGAELDAFQDIGEGLYETLIRVSTGISEAQYYTDRLGSAFETINYKDIVDTKGDVGFEALLQSIIKADEATYGLSNGVVQMISIMNTSAEELFDTYSTLEDIRNNIRITGQDEANLGQEMFMGAGGVEEFNDALNSFFDNFLTEGEKTAELTRRLEVEFAKLGVTAPTSVDEFKTMISEIDTSSFAGKELYGRMILLSESFSEVYGNADDTIDAVKNLSVAFEDMMHSIEKTIATLLGKSDSVDAQTQLIETYWEKRQEADELLAKNGDLTEKETARLQTLVGDIQSLSLNIQSASQGDNTQITNELVSELYGLKDELDFDNKILNVNIVGIEASLGISTSEGAGAITALPSFDVGTTNLTRDMIIQAHKGEAILPKTFNQGLQSGDLTLGNNKDIISAINNLNIRLSGIEENTKSTATALDEVRYGIRPLEVRVA